MLRSIWIGFDPREGSAFAVAKHSLRRHLNVPIPIRGLVLSELQASGLYSRDVAVHVNPLTGDRQLYDPISAAPMATEFAISRFLVPHLANKLMRNVSGRSQPQSWALFVDSDVLSRSSVEEIFKEAELHPEYAVMCVKHSFNPPEGIKMDGQAQVRYARKNWSSVMLFNVNHPANASLTPELVNALPGRDLHRFCWLADNEIGELATGWNYLVGHHTSNDAPAPALVHFTDGIPTMRGYEDCEFADEWRAELALWAARG